MRLCELYCDNCNLTKLEFLPFKLEKLYCCDNKISILYNLPETLQYMMVDSNVKILNPRFIFYPVSKINYNELLLKTETEIVSILNIPTWNYDEYFLCMFCNSYKNGIRLPCSPIHICCVICFINKFLILHNPMICNHCLKPFSMLECLFIKKIEK